MDSKKNLQFGNVFGYRNNAKNIFGKLLEELLQYLLQYSPHSILLMILQCFFCKVLVLLLQYC